MTISYKINSNPSPGTILHFTAGDSKSSVVSPELAANWITGEGDNRTLRAISWIETADQKGVIAETAMKYQNLGSWVQFAIRGIVLTQLVNCVHAAVSGKEPALPTASINNRVKDFEGRFKTIMSLRRG